jgi:hypothetical protein
LARRLFYLSLDTSLFWDEYCLVRLAVVMDNGEFWAIVSDEPTCLHTFQEYALRFDIEEAFLDDQSNG